jgi:hypothetical protein
MITPEFTYHLSETDSLFFKTYPTHFAIYSKHESSVETKIAEMRNGKWRFEDYNQRKLFFFLFNIYKKDFGKALKQYVRSLEEKPRTYIITCAKRRVDIKVTKMKRNLADWFYETFYGK